MTTRRWLSALVAFAIVVAAGSSAGLAACDCPCQPDTIVGLRDCIEHAFDMGHINQAGVAVSLAAKLDAAQAALDREEAAVASHLLAAFINEVTAQAGVHIDTEHAAHLLEHAEKIEAALAGMV